MAFLTDGRRNEHLLLGSGLDFLVLERHGLLISGYEAHGEFQEPLDVLGVLLVVRQHHPLMLEGPVFREENGHQIDREGPDQRVHELHFVVQDLHVDPVVLDLLAVLHALLEEEVLAPVGFVGAGNGVLRLAGLALAEAGDLDDGVDGLGGVVLD